MSLTHCGLKAFLMIPSDTNPGSLTSPFTDRGILTERSALIGYFPSVVGIAASSFSLPGFQILSPLLF